MPEQEYFEYTGGEPFSINMRAPRNTATRYASGPTPPKLPARRRMLFCDLDGVLADFDAGVPFVRRLVRYQLCRKSNTCAASQLYIFSNF